MEKVKQKTLGLALGSGGWRGMAHVGIIKSLIKNNVKIDFIAGSSAGALIGGMYSALGNIELIENIIQNTGYKELLLTFNDTHGIGSGLIKGNKAIEFLKKIGGNVDIENLKIPFNAVATDIEQGQIEVIKTGNLAKAIMASSTIPIVFEPTLVNEKVLVDGGVAMPVPVEVVRKMGADIVIGVDLYGNIFPLKGSRNKQGHPTKASMLRMSYQLLLSKLSAENCKNADICVVPKTPEGKFSMIKKFATDKFAITFGFDAMEEKINVVKELLE